MASRVSVVCSRAAAPRLAPARHARRESRRRPARPRASPSEHSALVEELASLDDGRLSQWALDNRDSITLDLLTWVAECEAAAGSVAERERLWALGSKLMALREGLVPVSSDALQRELREAAAAASAGRAAAADPSGEPGPRGRPEAELPAVTRGPSLQSVVRSTAALGLSPEGMLMLQQQAAALEAVVGQAKARSLVQVMGRARVADVPAMDLRLSRADSARRILEVLLEEPRREARAALLPEAFAPPDPGALAAEDLDSEADEELLYTTPLQLLQALDLYVSRLSGRSPGSTGQPELPGLSLGRPVEELLEELEALREDVIQYWEQSLADEV